MEEDDERRKRAPKGADFGPKPSGAPKKKAALAAALRANLARRKARERAQRAPALPKDGRDPTTDSEG